MSPCAFRSAPALPKPTWQPVHMRKGWMHPCLVWCMEFGACHVRLPTPSNTKRSWCCGHAHVIWHLWSAHAHSRPHRPFLPHTHPDAKPPQQTSPLQYRGLTCFVLSSGLQALRRCHLLPQREWQHLLGPSSPCTRVARCSTQWLLGPSSPCTRVARCSTQWLLGPSSPCTLVARCSTQWLLAPSTPCTPVLLCSTQWVPPRSRQCKMRTLLQMSTTWMQSTPCSSRRTTSSLPPRMSTSTHRRCRSLSKRMLSAHCCAACGRRVAERCFL